MEIIADGTHELVPRPKADTQSSVLYVTGSLGGGTATVGFLTGDDTDVFNPYSSGALAIDEQYEIKHGRGAVLAVLLVGATTPTLEVTTKLLSR